MPLVIDANNVAAITTHPRDPRAWKRAPQFGDQTTQQSPHAHGAAGVPRPQQRGDQVLPRGAFEGEGGDQRQITPRVIEPIEDRELLRAVRGIGGRIEIQCDDLGVAESSAQ
jgi:hypothetical protein